MPFKEKRTLNILRVQLLNMKEILNKQLGLVFQKQLQECGFL